MAISFNDIITKIVNWIKTNGNKEITGAQLREILIDISNALTEEVATGQIPFLNDDLFFQGGPSWDPAEKQLTTEQIALQYGVSLVNYIYNKGFFLGSGERALITKRYHDSFHKTNQIADLQIISSKNPLTFKAGDIEDTQTLIVDDIFFFKSSSDSSDNGLYVVGADNSVKLDSWDDSFNCSVIVLNTIDGRGSQFILNSDKSIQSGLYKSQDISGFVKVAAQLSIINS
jgi:hypothetical protein